MIRCDKPMIRCDKPMRRSKEKCLTPFDVPWRCNNHCESCICALIKQSNGAEHHYKEKGV